MKSKKSNINKELKRASAHHEALKQLEGLAKATPSDYLGEGIECVNYISYYVLRDLLNAETGIIHAQDFVGNKQLDVTVEKMLRFLHAYPSSNASGIITRSSSGRILNLFLYSVLYDGDVTEEVIADLTAAFDGKGELQFGNNCVGRMFA